MVREKCKVLLSQGSKCLKFWLLHFVKIHLAEPENDSERFSCVPKKCCILVFGKDITDKELCQKYNWYLDLDGGGVESLEMIRKRKCQI